MISRAKRKIHCSHRDSVQQSKWFRAHRLCVATRSQTRPESRASQASTEYCRGSLPCRCRSRADLYSSSMFSSLSSCEKRMIAQLTSICGHVILLCPSNMISVSLSRVSAKRGHRHNDRICIFASLRVRSCTNVSRCLFWSCRRFRAPHQVPVESQHVLIQSVD